MLMVLPPQLRAVVAGPGAAWPLLCVHVTGVIFSPLSFETPEGEGHGCHWAVLGFSMYEV